MLTLKSKFKLVLISLSKLKDYERLPVFILYAKGTNLERVGPRGFSNFSTIQICRNIQRAEGRSQFDAVL